MADRPALLQRGSYAFEGSGTPGTAVPATKRFVGLMLAPSPQAEKYNIIATGDQYARETGLNREWSDVSLSGTPTYDEITPLLSLYNGAPTITTPVGGTNARQHEWQGVNGVIPALRSITYEYGDANRAQQMAYVHGQDLTISIARAGDGVSVSGALMGRGMVDPFTLSGGVVALPVKPIEGVKADIYVDSTFAGLGTTKLLRAVSGSFALSGLVTQFFALNSTQSSFATTVPTRPEASATVRLGADEVGLPIAMGYRTGDRKFVRFEVKNGELIDVGIATTEYRLTIDLCLEVVTPGTFDEETGLLVVEPSFRVVHDDTAAFAWRIQACNSQLAI